MSARPENAGTPKTSRKSLPRPEQAAGPHKQRTGKERWNEEDHSRGEPSQRRIAALAAQASEQNEPYPDGKRHKADSEENNSGVPE